MKTRSSSLESDHLVALVGGGALTLSAVPVVLSPIAPSGLGSSFTPVLFFVGLLVLAYGLPGRPGVFGASRLVGRALVAATLISLAAAASSRLGPVDELAFTWQSWVLSGLEILGVVGVALAAVAAGRRPVVARPSRVGLAVIAGTMAVSASLPYVLFVLVDRGLVTYGFGGVWLLYPLCGLVTLAVGIRFAWPWLAPHVALARAALRRAWRRYVDSTP